jgi:glycosyltransferase involved in cell wall biosynthesis
MAEALARRGFAVEALTGTMLDLNLDVDPAEWLAGRGLGFEVSDGGSRTLDSRGLRADMPRHYRLSRGAVHLTLHHSPTSRLHVPERAELDEFLLLYSATLERFRPDVLVNFGGDALAHEVRTRARARGAAVVFAPHNLSYAFADPFTTADAMIVPSRFAAEYYRQTLGLECTVLSNLVDLSRVRVEDRDPRYLTFVNPSYEKGVYAFARIADELGRRRPDIAILVVESRGTEQTVADCGLDLRRHGTVHFMGHTHDPRHFWSVTRIGLMPSLAAETQGLAAMEAMTNGIPVIASDRGALPETVGGAGVVLPLPERLTPATRFPPTAEEVAPWVEAVIRL